MKGKTIFLFPIFYKELSNLFYFIYFTKPLFSFPNRITQLFFYIFRSRDPFYHRLVSRGRQELVHLEELSLEVYIFFYMHHMQ